MASTGNGAKPGVVVTLGLAGAVGRDPSASGWTVDVPALGSYPVGSGDAFLAGMLTRLSQDHSFDAALISGSAAAVANAEDPGPGVLEADRVDSLLGRVHVRRLE